MQHVCAKKLIEEHDTVTLLTLTPAADEFARVALLGRKQIAMQQVMQPRSKTRNAQPAPSRRRRRGSLETLVLGFALCVLALFMLPAIVGGKNLPAQIPAPQTAKPPQPQKAAAPAHAASTQRQPGSEAIAARPPASPAAIWPANQPPKQARVSWDGRGLEIEASNSSLNQILRQVAADTGARLEGLTQDQRIFGSYGPGRGCDVLSKLLDGSGYNVLMVGSRDTDAPLEILLSARSPASPQTAANSRTRSNSERDEPEPPPNYPPEPPDPQPDRNPFAIGDSPRDPVQFMQEILQRQQKIDQQQQNQQSDPQQ